MTGANCFKFEVVRWFRYDRKDWRTLRVRSGRECGQQEPHVVFGRLQNHVVDEGLVSGDSLNVHILVSPDDEVAPVGVKHKQTRLNRVVESVLLVEHQGVVVVDQTAVALLRVLLDGHRPCRVGTLYRQQTSLFEIYVYYHAVRSRHKPGKFFLTPKTCCLN